jgi:hypothetical protein
MKDSILVHSQYGKGYRLVKFVNDRRVGVKRFKSARGARVWAKANGYPVLSGLGV